MLIHVIQHGDSNKTIIFWDLFDMHTSLFFITGSTYHIKFINLIVKLIDQ